MMKKLFLAIVVVFGVNGLFAQDTLSDEELDYKLLSVSYLGKTDSILYWLNRGADPNVRSSDGITPLIYAIQSGKLEAVKALVYNGADVKFHDYYCIPPVFMAIARNQTDMVEFLLDHGADAEQLIDDDVSTLHYAIKYADTTVINNILSYKSLINKQDADGNSPLMTSVYFGRYDAIYLLCLNNASTDLQDKEGLTPFLLSIEMGDTIAANQLLQCGSMKSERSNNNYGMLEYALISKDNATLDWAIRNDTTNELNASLLKLTYILGNRKLTKTLRQHGAKTYYGFALQSFHLGFSEIFNSGDMMWGPTITLHEAHYGLNLSAMYYTRFWENRVFSQLDDYTYLQLWERRSLWGVSAAKTIKLYKNEWQTLMLSLGLSEYVTYGHYRGVNIKAPHFSFTSPLAEIWDKYKWGSIAFSAEYYKFKDVDSSPLRFKFSCFINIPLNEASYTNKKIDW